MDETSKCTKIKKHLKRNKERYIIGGVCLIAGVAIGVVGYKLLGNNIVDNSNVLKNEALVNIKPVINQQNTYVTQLVKRGHAGNVIKCNETGEIFASQNRAAEVMHISTSELSKHLRGKTAHINGYTFENLGEMPTG